MILLTFSCSDDDGMTNVSDDVTDNDEHTETTLTYNGTNGFVIDGGAFNETEFTMTESTGRSFFFVSFTSTSAFMTSDDATVELSMNTMSAGSTRSWGRKSGNVNIDVVIEIDGVRYVAEEGETTLSELGPVGGAMRGTFRGMLRNDADNEKTVRIAGAFTAERIE